PETSSLPPALMVVLLVLPPDSTICVPLVKTVAPLAKPNTSCAPPEIKAPRSVPPELTVSLPPAKIVVGSARPPDLRLSTPPLATMVLLAVPPDDTVSLPPDEMTAASVRPPEATRSCAPLPTLVFSAEPPPDTASVLGMRPLPTRVADRLVPPEDTVSWPP